MGHFIDTRIKSLPPGVRFTIVESAPAASLTQDEVELTGFTLQTHEEQSEITTDAATISEKANRYPSVKTQDLSRLRKLIEDGKAAEFADVVWDNPRHLITSGDTPEILQVPTRSNALHCGASQCQLAVCKEVIAIIESSRFWELIYPDDTAETRAKRRDHLIDLYLNMQDKIVSIVCVASPPGSSLCWGDGMSVHGPKFIKHHVRLVQFYTQYYRFRKQQ